MSNQLAVKEQKVMNAGFFRECIDYNPLTGVATWKKRPRSHFKSDIAHKAFNTSRAGKECKGGYVGKTGKQYQRINISGQRYYLHRVIMSYMGVDIKNDQMVDHINCNGLDNRWANLRVVSAKQNQRNRQMQKNNSSGANGVYRKNKKHLAQIKLNGKSVHLGYFDTFEDALAARIDSEIKNGFHKNHGENRI